MADYKTKVRKLADQSLNEINFARVFKQGKVRNWQLNEQMYYGKKYKTEQARTNMELGRMQEFVHTLLSKIDNPLVFKFVKRKNSQLKRAELLNALRVADADRDNWDIKDLAGKKQAIIYGRAIYSYYADSIDGIYKPHLENVDVYDFLIDPSCGGLEIEAARNLGSYDVTLDKRQLKEGVKNKVFIRTTTEQLIAGNGNITSPTTEITNERSRMYDQNTIGQKENEDPTKYKFWRWFTTSQDDGERYYLLMDNSGNCIRCERVVDMFPATEQFPLGAWPYWTWAAFLDLTEFWTPSYCDYSRDLFMGQNVSINQMFDNAEAINKPQRVVNVGAIENLAELKYRRDGIIKTKGDYDINKVYQVIQTPSINTPIQVFNLLEGIQEKASGVTAAAKGVADEQGKVGIYEGNQEEAAERFNLLNKSYAFGYKRFSVLYQEGVRENLTKKIAVDLIGPNGVEIVEVKRSDIFRKGEKFGIMVEASNAEMLASEKKQAQRVAFLAAQNQNRLVNQEKNFEMQAKSSGITEDEVQQLLDTSFFGNSELMSEADRDMEKLLDGDDIEPNENANNAYKQRMVTYLKDHKEDVTFKQFARISMYIDSLDEIIFKNEARQLQQEEITRLNQEMQPPSPGETITTDKITTPQLPKLPAYGV